MCHWITTCAKWYNCRQPELYPCLTHHRSCLEVSLKVENMHFNIFSAKKEKEKVHFILVPLLFINFLSLLYSFTIDLCGLIYFLLCRGCFDICSEVCFPVVAHLSSKACKRVCKGARMLPSIICLDKKSRLQSQPDSLRRSQPTSDTIALYFFPYSDR